MLVANYQIDQKRTLIVCCMALGTWFGGMAITAAVRILASEGRLPITVCTPGLNLSEAVEIFSRFHRNYDQSLWFSNPSSIGLISALMKKKGIEPAPGSVYFPVVGEYFSEAFRDSVAAKYGHDQDAPFVVWTGYGSADAGDLGVETADLIQLRKFFHRNESERKKVFGTDDTPMLLMPASSKHLEIIDGRIVVSADHLVPLVRYDTGDEGGFIEKKDLPSGIDAELLKRLPEKLLFVRGRVNDNVIFYGTNLNVQEINNHFLVLPKDYGYAGLFTVRQKEQSGVVFFDFAVFVENASDSTLASRYKETLLEFLKAQSLEFKTKYANLTQSVGEELIRVTLQEYKSGEGRIKHRFIVTGE
ncbi:MAG TPA: phenylacetate--CoA ligase [Bdellovibrionales bacterium]|nr:phenylacetate--CoA ligase [Bdellovibrionales bacterium]